MKRTKPTVTIGIPAYNEEANIRRLIQIILRMSRKRFRLLEILIACDGCSDRTVQKIRSLNSNYVRIIHGKQRMGQQVRQNQLLERSRGEIIILAEADTVPNRADVFDELIRPFSQNRASDIGMVVGNVLSERPSNGFQAITTHGDAMMKRLFDRWKRGTNMYTIGGHALRAIPRHVASDIRWPSDVPEDAYLYLYLRHKGLTIIKARRATTVKRTVANLQDRFRQSTKFVSGRNELYRHFPAELVTGEYTIPKAILLRHLCMETLRNPYPTIAYITQTMLHRASTVRIPRFTALYTPYYSTKGVIQT